MCSKFIKISNSTYATIFGFEMETIFFMIRGLEFGVWSFLRVFRKSFNNFMNL